MADECEHKTAVIIRKGKTTDGRRWAIIRCEWGCGETLLSIDDKRGYTHTATIGEVLANAQPDAMEELVRLREQVRVLRAVLGDMIDTHPCRHDSDGNCQEHGGYDKNGVCLNAKAIATLEATE